MVSCCCGGQGDGERQRGTNTDESTRCNNNLLIYKISSTCFRQYFAHLQERETEIFTAYGIVSCCCGGQGDGERQRGTNTDEPTRCNNDLLIYMISSTCFG